MAPLRAAGTAAEPPEIPLELRVKSAFLFNFARFVQWPGEAFPDAGTPIVLGVLGDAALGEALRQTLRGKTVQGRPVQIQTFRRAETLSPCHLLFVGERAAGRLPLALEALKGFPVLFVGESERFARRGGVINLVYEGSATRFEINLDAAERARLQISSRLLGLARVLRDGEGPDE
jgi:hypothetical protein